MLIEVSEHGTIRTTSWDDGWWERVKATEARLGRAICGSEAGKFTVCEEPPASRIGRCRKHYRIVETSSDVFRDPVYSSGARGLRVCGDQCPRSGTCEYYSEYFSKRPQDYRPYCFIEVEIYCNQVKELLNEVEADKTQVTQFIKNAIQMIATSMVQVGRCDEELAEGTIVTEEVSVWKVGQSERTTTTPKENPAVGARAKLMKAIADISKSLILPPHTKKEVKQAKDDDPGAKSPMEYAGQLAGKAGKLELVE